MRNCVFDVPNEDDLVLVDSCICLPIEISHCVKFTPLGPGSPGSHERTVNSLFVHKILENSHECEEVIFDVIQEVRVLNSETLLDKSIKHGIHNVTCKISGVGGEDESPFEEVSQFAYVVDLETCALDS